MHDWLRRLCCAENPLKMYCTYFIMLYIITKYRIQSFCQLGFFKLLQVLYFFLGLIDHRPHFRGGGGHYLWVTFSLKTEVHSLKWMMMGFKKPVLAVEYVIHYISWSFLWWCERVAQFTALYKISRVSLLIRDQSEQTEDRGSAWSLSGRLIPSL